jgi:cyclopropane fatty-acyl-phospholipid synthase-like methyltransferase
MVTTYDGRTKEEWLKELEGVREFNRRHLLAMFAVLGIPETFLDVGCGDGGMVVTASALGVSAFGVDQLVENDNEIFFHHNLVDPFQLPQPVSLVTCLEVAEHLHSSAHAVLCDTLANNLAIGSGNFLVFTSAYPGQGGSAHLSERPAQYWHNEFALRHLNFRLDITRNLSLVWSNINSPLFYLAANVMVFEK